MRVIRATDMRACELPDGALDPDGCEIAYASIAGVTMELRTNVPGLGRAFAHRYSEHPRSGAVDFTYCVDQDANGYVLWCDHDGALRWDGVLPLDAVLFLTDAAALSALLHFDGALASLHAAGVAFDGVAAAIAADSTGGKTTTALACARGGLQIYSDERVVLRDGVVHRFLRRCRVREGGARLLDIDAGEISWRETFGERIGAAPAPLRVLFVIAAKGARAAVEPLAPGAALHAVARWYDCKGDALQRMSRALQTVRSVRCFALTLGTPEESARAIRATLQAELVA